MVQIPTDNETDSDDGQGFEDIIIQTAMGGKRAFWDNKKRIFLSATTLYNSYTHLKPGNWKSVKKYLEESDVVLKYAEADIYDPTKESGLTTDGDVVKKYVINTFDDRSVPNYVEFNNCDNEQAFAIEFFKEHVLALVNGNKERYKILMDFLASQRLRMGFKIRWSPVIFGDEGIGKGQLFKIIRAMIGKANADTVLASRLASNFNSVFMGKSFMCLDEADKLDTDKFQTTGKNNLKELLSELEVTQERKGGDATSIRNPCNYIIFANDIGSFPIAKDARRFWAIACDMPAVASANPNEPYNGNKFGFKPNEYFMQLSKCVEHADAIAGFFEEGYKIETDEVINGTYAPYGTDDMNKLVDEFNSATDGFEEIKALITHDYSRAPEMEEFFGQCSADSLDRYISEYVSVDFVNLDHLKKIVNAYRGDTRQKPIKAHRISHVLNHLGYFSFKNPVRFHDEKNVKKSLRFFIKDKLLMEKDISLMVQESITQIDANKLEFQKEMIGVNFV